MHARKMKGCCLMYKAKGGGGSANVPERILSLGGLGAIITAYSSLER